MHDTAQKMPPLAEFLLTKHLPCASLAFAMLSGVVWLPGLFMSVPALAVLMSFVAIIIHAMTPALIMIIFMGGGIRYTLQVLVILSIMMLFASSMHIGLTLLVISLYALLPMGAAWMLYRPQGLDAAARLLLLSVSVGVLLGLMGMAQTSGLDLHAQMDALLAPVFSSMTASGAGLPTEATAELHQLLSWSLPGLLMFGIWSVWWTNVLYARNIAIKYGFYTGDERSVLSLNLGRYVAYLLLLCLLLGNLTGGILQYSAVSFALVLAGAMSIQGISVMHTWLKVHDMPMAIVLMYVLLFIWSMMVIPFIILGLLDIWYDYRRGLDSTSGGN